MGEDKLNKRIAMLLVLVMVLALGGQLPAAQASAGKSAQGTESTMIVNGERWYIYGYNIDYANYFRLRDVAVAMNNTPSEFNVGWNSQANAIALTSGQPYTGERPADNFGWDSKRAVPSSSALIVDGKAHTMQAYVIDQETYFQLRDLAAITGFQVAYDRADDTIYMNSKAPKDAYHAASKGTLENNAQGREYTRWASPIQQYVYANKDQTLTTVDASDKLYIHTYNDRFELVSSVAMDYELPMFGAFYSGSDYNYIVFGQENKAEKDSLEVLRVVKYDKQFKRISSAAVTNAYTVIPFDAGSARLAEQGSTLVLHTARERYTTEDGLNHQSQLTVMIDSEKMQVTNDLGRFQKNHVSHSFDQYVLFDGAEHVLLDHGDAYPRSIVIQKGDGLSYVERDVVTIPGRIGANATGVSLGGFEQSGSSYLVAYNTINHNAATEYTSYEISGADDREREIKIAAVPRSNVEQGDITYTSIASYIGKKQRASVPQLVKLGEESFMLLWQEFESDDYDAASLVKYVQLDGKGNKVGAIKSVRYFKLSQVSPIVYNNRIVWFTNEQNQRTFYTIPLT